MILSPTCQSLLSAWLSGDWCSTRAPDIERFFCFIEQYIVDHGLSLDENDLVNKIVEKVGIKRTDEARDAVALMRETLTNRGHS